MNRKKAVEKLNIFRKIIKYITGINIVTGPNNTYTTKAFKLPNFFFISLHISLSRTKIYLIQLFEEVFFIKFDVDGYN
jgi:hypothetical protein